MENPPEPDYQRMQRKADIERLAQEAARNRKERMARKPLDDAYDRGFCDGFEEARRLYNS